MIAITISIATLIISSPYLSSQSKVKNDTVVFCYHNVLPKPNNSHYTVTTAQLAEQVSLMQRSGFEIINLDQAWTRFKNPISHADQIKQDKKASPDLLSDNSAVNSSDKPTNSRKPAVLLTFDDGYPSLKNHVAPLLKKMNVPATFFIYTNRINNREPDTKQPATFLTWTDLNQMLADGFFIQSHSISHGKLESGLASRSWTQLAKSYRELVASQEILRGRMPHNRIYSFAFPYGYFTDETVQQAFDAGYSMLFSTDGRQFQEYPQGMLVGRYTIEGKTSLASIKKILAQYQPDPQPLP